MDTPRVATPLDQPFWASPRTAVPILVALSIPLFFLKIGSAPLLDPDEPYYAVPALEMLKAHSWAVPLFRGEPWFDKPVLYYWVVLAAYKLLGVGETAARIGSAIAGLGGVLAMATMAPRAWRVGGAHVLGALVLATGLEYAFLSRAAITDMTLTFFLTVGFLAVARYLESGRLAGAVVAGAAFGLAVLTKGPVGAIVPAVGLAAYAFWMRRRELAAPKALGAALAGFLLTAAPWYAYMAVAHLDLVVRVFLGEENLGRFMSPEHRQIPFFYVVVFLVGMVPWSAALPSAIVRAARVAWKRDEGPGTSPGPAFALAWAAAVVGIFSLSASKLLTYVLPAFPPAAFLIGHWWLEAFAARAPGAPRRVSATVVAAVGAVIAGLVAAAALVAGRTPRFTPAFAAVAVLAVVLIAGSLAGVAAARAGRIGRFAASQAALGVALVVVGVMFVLPAIQAGDSTRALVATLTGRGLDGRLAGAYRVPDVSLEFYLGRPVPRETEAASLARRVAADPGGLWVLNTQEVDRAAAEAGLTAERVVVEGRRSVVRLVPR